MASSPTKAHRPPSSSNGDKGQNIQVFVRYTQFSIPSKTLLNDFMNKRDVNSTLVLPKWPGVGPCFHFWACFILLMPGVGLLMTVRKLSVLIVWLIHPTPRRSPLRRRPPPPSPRHSSSIKSLVSRASSWRFTGVWLSPLLARFLENKFCQQSFLWITWR